MYEVSPHYRGSSELYAELDGIPIDFENKIRLRDTFKATTSAAFKATIRAVRVPGVPSPLQHACALGVLFQPSERLSARVPGFGDIHTRMWRPKRYALPVGHTLCLLSLVLQTARH